MTKEEYFALFDQGVNRENTGCCKWDGRQAVFGRADATPLWVADMDFASPAEVTDALVARARHGVVGYPDDDPAIAQTVCDWMKARHGLSIAPEQTLPSPGVVDSLSFAINAFTDPGDLVAIQPPVYGPFERSVKNTGRRLYKNCLRQTENGWEMDLENLEVGLRRGVKMLLLCSPHNPVGRVWTRGELQAAGDLCERYGARVVSDEIHADFEMPGFRHTPMLCVHPNAVSFVSATKTFNLAGMRSSTMLFGNAADREKMQAFLTRMGLGEINLFGKLAQTAAYAHGAPWLDALLEYLDGTRSAVEALIAEKMPRVKVSRLEGTYLMWLDMRDYGLEQKELERKMVFEAGAAFSGGMSFCEEGRGFLRMNIATPRANVLGALARAADVLAKI